MLFRGEEKSAVPAPLPELRVGNAQLDVLGLVSLFTWVDIGRLRDYDNYLRRNVPNLAPCVWSWGTMGSTEYHDLRVLLSLID
jgi:hypothetical protein